ncbi:MAG: TIGR03790 family protein [Kiritimatiellia bacterium]|jgi:uncharacterized protein (TIGR03790 family)
MPRHGRIGATMKWLAGAALAIALSLGASPACALGPHEVVLVINDASLDSILLGQVYQRLRSIPPSNVVRVSIPTNVYDGVSTDISPDDFARHIWLPVTAAITEAGIAPQALALVYSCGFPTRVTTQPPMSLTGLTFTRNRIPDSELIASGRYVSELFAGPSSAVGSPEPSATFDLMRNRLLEAMPLPSMMLAFTGARGITVMEAVTALERSAASDHTAPDGTVYFAVNDDVRSTCRHWQYQGAATALKSRYNVRAVVSTNLPAASDFPLIGFMTGSRTVPGDRLTLAPGAFADNLTSFGAAFHQAAHMKATTWLKAGAAFSAGTVDEPYAIWAKFPSASIFLHALAGCTAIESFYQSVLSPLQILPVGDPLAKPWAPRIEPVVDPVAEPLVGIVELKAEVKNEDPAVFLRFNWLVDGKLAGSGRSFVWNTRTAADGPHVVRVVVRRQLESVRHQGFADIRVEVANGGVE